MQNNKNNNKNNNNKITKIKYLFYSLVLSDTVWLRSKRGHLEHRRPNNFSLAQSRESTAQPRTSQGNGQETETKEGQIEATNETVIDDVKEPVKQINAVKNSVTIDL